MNHTIISDWRLDQSRVWITYGEPSSIELRDRTEVWHYYNIERIVYFIFLDKRGTGLFELVDSDKEGEIHYPYWQRKLTR